MVYSYIGARLQNRIVFRELSNFGRERTVTFGISSGDFISPTIALDPKREVVFWSQGQNVYASSFHKSLENGEKVSRKLIADSTVLSSQMVSQISSKSGEALEIKAMAYDQENDWLYVMLVTPYPSIGDFSFFSSSVRRSIIRVSRLRANGEDHKVLNIKVVRGEVFSSLVICQGKISFFFAQDLGSSGFSSFFLSQSELSQLVKTDIDPDTGSSKDSRFQARNLPIAQQEMDSKSCKF